MVALTYLKVNGKKNINDVLEGYNNSNDNPVVNKEFYGRLDGYSKNRIYLKGPDFNIKCLIKKESFDKYIKVLYAKKKSNQENIYVFMEGIPYYCGRDLQLAVKQGKIHYVK